MASDAIRAAPAVADQGRSGASRLRGLLIGTIGFLTLVDLFAAQAVLPSLAAAYGVSPSAMGVAVNASTIGMAAASLAVAIFGGRVEQRAGIWVSLALLAVPTSLLAVAPDLWSFAALRVVQGVFMATAFALTMAYLADHSHGERTAEALAAYVTGVVASNLIGRLVAGSVADQLGLAANFGVFALLNLAGAVLVFMNLDRMARMAGSAIPGATLDAWQTHVGNPSLRAAFAEGFLILFAFIGVFTYVNFVLAGPRLAVGQMSLGLVYLVFLPALVTTPLAGRLALRIGPARALLVGLGIAGGGLPLLLAPYLPAVLLGMVLVGVGTFLAQAIATGFVGRTATRDRAVASGLYLASYYLGGLAGALVIGQLFDRLGWTAAVAGIAVALSFAASLALGMRESDRPEQGS